MSGESARSRTCAAGRGIQNLQEKNCLFITLSKRGEPPWLTKQGQKSPEVKNRCISGATKMNNFLQLFEQVVPHLILKHILVLEFLESNENSVIVHKPERKEVYKQKREPLTLALMCPDTTWSGFRPTSLSISVRKLVFESTWSLICGLRWRNGMYGARRVSCSTVAWKNPPPQN